MREGEGRGGRGRERGEGREGERNELLIYRLDNKSTAVPSIEV